MEIYKKNLAYYQKYHVEKRNNPGNVARRKAFQMKFLRNSLGIKSALKPRKQSGRSDLGHEISESTTVSSSTEVPNEFNEFVASNCLNNETVKEIKRTDALTESAVYDRIKNAKIEFREENNEHIDNILNGVDSEDVVIEKFNIPIKKKSFRRLRPGKWLDDELINFYVELLSERDINLSAKYPDRKKSVYFNTFFIEKLTGASKSEFIYENVKKWLHKRKSNTCIFECDKVFVPINITQSHWVLVVIFVQEKRIAYFNSLRGSKEYDGTVFVDALLKWVKEEANTENLAFDSSEWTLQYEGESPQQDNGCDCGIFVLMLIDFFTDSLEVDANCFTQEIVTNTSRRKLANDIFKGCLSYVMEAVGYF
jgi:sentrin-specific protease 1